MLFYDFGVISEYLISYFEFCIITSTYWLKQFNFFTKKE
jgi:hypothetical protein